MPVADQDRFKLGAAAPIAPAPSRALGRPLSPRQPLLSSRQAASLGLILTVLLFALYGNVGRYIIFNPFINGSAHDVSFSDYFFTRVKYVISFAVLVYGIITPAPRGYSLRAFVSTLPFVLWTMLSTMWSVEVSSTSRGAIQLFGFCAAAAVLVGRVGVVKMARCCIGVIALVCVASAFVAVAFPQIGQHQSTDLLQSTHAGLWRGIMGHKNLLGPYAALGCALLFTSERLLAFPKWLLWISRLSAAACLVFSGNATAIPELVAMLAVYFSFRSRKMLTPSGILVVFTVLILCASSMTMVGGLVAELLGRDPTFSGRTVIWARSIGVWLDNSPFIGSGYAASLLILVPVLTRELFQSATSAHSGYISILLDVGAIGFAAFGFALFTSIANGLKTMASAPTSIREGELYFDAKLAMLITLTGNLVGAIAEPSALELFGVGHLTFAAIIVLGAPTVVRRIGSVRRT